MVHLAESILHRGLARRNVLAFTFDSKDQRKVKVKVCD